MTRSVRLIISGRVQRVGYRHWTDQQAQEIGLDGWVRNLPDGTVEAVFSGTADQVENMIERCFSGPTLAKVVDIKVSPTSPPGEPGFIQYRH